MNASSPSSMFGGGKPVRIAKGVRGISGHWYFLEQEGAAATAGAPLAQQQQASTNIKARALLARNRHQNSYIYTLKSPSGRILYTEQIDRNPNDRTTYVGVKSRYVFVLSSDEGNKGILMRCVPGHQNAPGAPSGFFQHARQRLRYVEMMPEPEHPTWRSGAVTSSWFSALMSCLCLHAVRTPPPPVSYYEGISGEGNDFEHDALFAQQAHTFACRFHCDNAEKFLREVSAGDDSLYVMA